MRGEAVALFDGVQTPGNEVLVSMGIILVPEGTGTTVLWSPFTDGDAPWIWYDVFTLAYEETVTDVIAGQNVLSARRVIDNKAMRIMRNQELQLVIENTTLNNVASVIAHAAGRILTGT
jgi:hypothetical protein